MTQAAPVAPISVKATTNIFELMLSPQRADGPVLLDIESFEHRPEELLAALKELGHPVPLLAVDPWSEPLAAGLVSAGLAADYLVRPVTEGDLAAAQLAASRRALKATPVTQPVVQPLRSVMEAVPRVEVKHTSGGLAGELLGLVSQHGERAWTHLPLALNIALPVGISAAATNGAKELYLSATVAPDRAVTLYTVDGSHLAAAAAWLEANRAVLSAFAATCNRMKALSTLVTTDGPTGLANARYFSHLLTQAMGRAKEQKVTLHLAVVRVTAESAAGVAAKLAPEKSRCITGRLDEELLVVATWGGEAATLARHIRGLGNAEGRVVTYPFDGATGAELLTALKR